MKHLGDITKISGYDAPVVDCIIGGSPCQDLSVAGKRAGLAGERSGLYMEQIRIIKEMRDADRKRGRTGQLVRPRFMVWENVPGAFSSNKGEDFAAVLEEAVRIAEPEAPPVAVPDRGWPLEGCFFGEDGSWSVAWRVLDAQFWGVPQRRRRIALVADFGGLSAPEILFVRKGVSGDTEPGGTERKGPATAAESGSGAADREGESRDVIAFAQNQRDEVRDLRDIAGTLQAKQGTKQQTYVAQFGSLGTCPVYSLSAKQQSLSVGVDVAATLGACDHKEPQVVCAPVDSCILDDQGGQQISVRTDGKCPTLRAEMHGNIPCVMQAHVWDCRVNGDGKTAATLTGDHENRVTDYSNCLVMATGQARAEISYGVASTGCCNHDQPIVVSCEAIRCIVRRLTPLECGRLQGYPDGWVDIGRWTDSRGRIRDATDSAKYKAFGNSIAIPPWKWVLKRLCAQYERDATMASLFDGIGGFPLIWEQLNGEGSCLWASEIEEFPMAVTAARFGRE